jgi:hypothetical protein
MGHGPDSSKLVVICVVLLLLVLFYVFFVCKCVLYYCHRLATQLQLINISYQIDKRKFKLATIWKMQADIRKLEAEKILWTQTARRKA